MRRKASLQREFVDWDQQPLGRVADAVLAEQLGVTTASVARARRARGIPIKTDGKLRGSGFK